MWRHLEYVRSQCLRPDPRMYAFVISTCATAEPPSARNAFVAMKCLADMQARRQPRLLIPALFIPRRARQTRTLRPCAAGQPCCKTLICVMSIATQCSFVTDAQA